MLRDIKKQIVEDMDILIPKEEEELYIEVIKALNKLILYKESPID